jgi:fructoselysine transporter
VSEFVHQLSGSTAANIVTLTDLMGRICFCFFCNAGLQPHPLCRCDDGSFFKIFAKLHPTKHFPYVSLLFLEGSLLLSVLLFKLHEIISAILAMRILIQFIGQGIGLVLLVKRKGKQHFAWRMPLYPLPVILAILMWGYIFFSTGQKMMMGGLTVIVLGVIAYLVKARRNKEWPW